MLNVHHKTVQRWLAETNEIKKNVPLLVKAAAKERATIRRKARKEGYSPPQVAVQPPSRRMTRIDPFDPKGERLIWDTQIAYEVKVLPEEDMLGILGEYRRRALALGKKSVSNVRFLIEFTPSPDYPRGKKQTEPRSLKGRATPKQLIDEARKQGAILEMRVIDPSLK